MKNISLIFIAFAMTVAGVFSAPAQSNDGRIAEQIMKLETEYTEATKKLSAEDFDRFYAVDFMVTARIPPIIVTKAERLALLKSSNFRRGITESYTNTDVKVRVYGDDTVIVTGAWKRLSKDTDGKDTSASGRFTHVWIKQSGKWLLAAAHYSPDIDLEKLRAPQTENRKN